MNRSSALLLMSSGIALTCCRGVTSPIRVGSKDFSENILLGEIFAFALEACQIVVVRRMIFQGGATQMADEIPNDHIDLYPEYTGTGYMDVLDLGRPRSGQDTFPSLCEGYERRFNATWLRPAQANDSQGLAVPSSSRLKTLSQCSVAAPRLRLAAAEEFINGRADGLRGLAAFYGGFNFRTVHPVEGALTMGQQYDVISDGNADVIAVSTTDSQIRRGNLRVLNDDRHFWPLYQVAPVIRKTLLAERPQIRQVLDAITARLSQDTLQQLNDHVDEGRDPADVAAAFVQQRCLAPAPSAQTSPRRRQARGRAAFHRAEPPLA